MTDKSGVGNNGTITNMSTSTSPVPGVAGQALNFDGVNDYVDLPFVLNPSTTNFTTSLWFKLNILATVKGDQHTLLSQENGTGTGRSWMYIYLTDNSLVTLLGGSIQSSGVTPTINQWYHSVLVWNGSTLQWYVDGVVKNSSSPTLESADGGNFIGVTKTLASGWTNGSIDEVRIYNRALSASEVSELYRAGR